MSLISEQEMKDLKKSNTVVIWGCGSSLNDFPDWSFDNLKKFDSISFNWFCFSCHSITYYLVREQANLEKRTNGEENIDNFYDIMNYSYINSCLVVHDLSLHSPHAYDYSSEKNIAKFNSKYVVVKDTKLKDNDPGVKLWRDKSIFKSGIYHGKTTLTNALHLAVWLGYKKIIFAGVDLYDSRYFWLNNNDTRYSVSDKKKDRTAKHATVSAVMKLVKDVKKYYPKIKMYTYNPKSLLKNVIPVWKK